LRFRIVEIAANITKYGSGGPNDMKLRTAIQRTYTCKRGERGYAIMLVLFFLTLMLVATISIAPNILTQGRREKETEMIWRGKQYARGIRFYFRKNGKLPTSLEELTKPGVGGVRFMRQAYKDPMNTKDGEWRFIYVGPAGQLIGSLRPAQTILLPRAPNTNTLTPAQLAQQGQAYGKAVNQTLANPQIPGADSALSGNEQPNSVGQPVSFGAPAAPAGTDASSTDPSGSSSAAADEEALLASDPITIMGGNIIGVGSKINHSSIIIYETAKNYKRFEFIWDPSVNPITVVGAASAQVGVPAGQPSSATPLASPPGPAANPNSPSTSSNPEPVLQEPPTTPPPQ
jgi:hypothetical protein